MAAPATTGVLRTAVAEMQVGDYIKASFQADLIGTPNIGSDVNSSLTIEFPNTGKAYGDAGSYIFYFVKVDKGLLIADRVIAHSVSWDTLNSKKFIQGIPATEDSANTPVTGMHRSLTGGVSYIDANGNSSTTKSSLGAWPTNNEWDKYITNFPADKIASGKTLDDVFHHTLNNTWAQDTIISSMGTSDRRVSRKSTEVWYWVSSTIDVSFGFRPVFAYKEV